MIKKIVALALAVMLLAVSLPRAMTADATASPTNNTENILEASSIQYGSSAYADVLNSAIIESMYHSDAGFFYDLDYDGVNELFLHYIPNEPQVYGVPSSACSVFTVSDNVVKTLINKKQLTPQAGGGDSDIGIYQLDGQVVFGAFHSSFGDVNGADNWDFYSYKDKKFTLVTQVRAEYSSDSSYAFVGKVAYFDGQKKPYSEYEQWLKTLKTVMKAGDRYDDSDVGLTFEVLRSRCVLGTDSADVCYYFIDINRSAWYHTAADFVLECGLMGSTKIDKLTFEPTTACTRAMIAQMLYSLEGKPAVTFKDKFPDIKKGQWFTDAVMWAYQNGVVSGYDNGKFGPNDKVTREQMAVILKAYTEKVKGLNTSATTSLSGFADAGKVTWSKPYIQWAVAEGLLSGKAQNGKTYLDPQGNATRAEVAAIMRSFILNIIEAN